jgi:hypothetical protein
MGDRMSVQLPVVDFTTEQRVLWTRVHELWELTKKGDQGQIRSALHPHYVGWDMSAQIPHDREAAVLSESGNPPTLREYKLHPLSVQVYDGAVGVVHYSYSAVVGSGGTEPEQVTGRWALLDSESTPGSWRNSDVSRPCAWSRFAPRTPGPCSMSVFQ